MGGEFKDGFKTAFITAAANYLYSASTNSEQSASWKKGKGVPSMKDPDTGKIILGQYDESKGSSIPWLKNVSGNNKALTGDYWKDFWTQGGAVSKFLNASPGGGATSRVHDSWLNPNYGGLNSVWNFPTMIPAAVLTYTALADSQVTNYLIYKNSKKGY